MREGVPGVDHPPTGGRVGRRGPLPPALFLGALLAIGLLAVLPQGLPRWPGGLLASVGLGVLLLAFGVLMAVGAKRQFRHVGTGVVPLSPSTVLVEDGWFRLSRNPMYLGMLLALLGVAVASGAWLALLVPPLFGALLHRRFVLPEEAHMQASFGAAYADYCRRVRRWL